MEKYETQKMILTKVILGVSIIVAYMVGLVLLVANLQPVILQLVVLFSGIGVMTYGIYLVCKYDDRKMQEFYQKRKAERDVEYDEAVRLGEIN